MRQDAPRLSRRAVRLSLRWQAPTMTDPLERNRPDAGDAEANIWKTNTHENTPDQDDAQAARDGGA